MSEDLEQLRARIQRAEARFTRLYASSPDAIMVLFKEAMKVVSANPAFNRMFGTSFAVEHALEAPPSEARADDVALESIVDRRDWQTFAEIIDAHNRGVLEGLHHTVRMHRIDDDEAFTCTVMFHEAADHPVAILSLRDISESLRAEEQIAAYSRELEETNAHLRGAQAQLVQQGKMAALGTLVAGVAHDINTPLGSIKANAELAQTLAERIKQGVPALDPKVGRSLSALEGAMTTLLLASERIHGIVGALRSFARLDESALKEVNLHEGLDSTLQLVGHLFERRIQVHKRYGALPNVRCRPGEINQVFMNLLTNAVQAITGEGTITVTTALDGADVVVTIADTGVGIAPEHLARVFDPGFTTKGVGVGTGLGLAIAYRILSEHGGAIAVASERGEGATFTVRLPVAGP